MAECHLVGAVSHEAPEVRIALKRISWNRRDRENNCKQKSEHVSFSFLKATFSKNVQLFSHFDSLRLSITSQLPNGARNVRPHRVDTSCRIESNLFRHDSV